MTFFSVDERRRWERQWAAVPVVIRHRGSRVDGVTINISQGGMYLFAAANLPLGSQLEMDFVPPGATQLISTYAIVRRRALYLYGIEFLADNVAVASRNTIADSDDMRAS